MGALEAVILTIITAATPLLLAAIGELVTERSGVLNLGVEGMMIMGAVCGFAAAYTSGSALLGVAVFLLAFQDLYQRGNRLARRARQQQ